MLCDVAPLDRNWLQQIIRTILGLALIGVAEFLRDIRPEPRLYSGWIGRKGGILESNY